MSLIMIGRAIALVSALLLLAAAGIREDGDAGGHRFEGDVGEALVGGGDGEQIEGAKP